MVPHSFVLTHTLIDNHLLTVGSRLTSITKDVPIPFSSLQCFVNNYNFDIIKQLLENLLASPSITICKAPIDTFPRHAFSTSPSRDSLRSFPSAMRRKCINVIFQLRKLPFNNLNSICNRYESNAKSPSGVVSINSRYIYNNNPKVGKRNVFSILTVLVSKRRFSS